MTPDDAPPPLSKGQKRIGQILLDRGEITEAVLSAALASQKKDGRFLGEILVSLGAINEETLAKSLSEQLGIAFVNVSEMVTESEALKMLPRELCEEHDILPLFVAQNTLTCVMANALDVVAIDLIQKRAGSRVRPVFGTLSAIRKAIERVYGSVPDEATPQQQKNANTPQAQQQAAPGRAGIQVMSDMNESAGQREKDPEALLNIANATTTVEMVTNLMEKAVEMAASDIHLEPERESFNCRYRVDGVMHLVAQLPAEDQSAIISRIKIMANMDIAEKRLPQDGRIRMVAAKKEIDLRISTFPAIHGENVVIRILDRSRGVLTLEQLGAPDYIRDEFRKLVHKPHGILLVTGPTGSGKTTTLYAALSELNTVEKNIITLEDPVEYELVQVRQAQINLKAGLTFASGLRSILRQDPDIIMIGEIRDRETAEIAIHAALTGHLVLSTLHTNDAPAAATRLIDMGVEPFLVGSSMSGILAQRLLRLLCPYCKEPYKPTPELLKDIGVNPDEQKEPITIYREKGCAKCKNYGYLKRTGTFELMVPNDEIKELIAEKVSANRIREAAIRAGMRTLRMTAEEKVLTGETSISELYRVTEQEAA